MRCPVCRVSSALACGAPCPCGRAALVPDDAFLRGDGDPLLGRTLLDRFVLLGLHRTGACSAVYDTLDRARAERCLTKVRRHELEPASLAEEARLLGLTTATPKALACGEGALAPGVEAAFLVMSVAAGESLAARLGAGPPPAPEEARAVVGAAAALHEAGIAHGDLKPAHLFLAPSGATVIDLGSAQEVGGPAPTSSGPSPGYAPPEWSPGDAPTQAADVFALGRVLEAWARGADEPFGPAIRAALSAAPARRPRDARALAGLLP